MGRTCFDRVGRKSETNNIFFRPSDASIVQGITFKMAAVTVESCRQKVKKEDKSGNMFVNINFMDNLNAKWNIEQVNIIFDRFHAVFLNWIPKS